MGRIMRSTLATVGVALVVVFAAACGSSSSSKTSSGSTSSSSSSGSGLQAVPTSGPGLTEPSAPSGSKVSGGTVYFTQGTMAPPNYIFPMYSFAVCGINNINQLMDILYRPVLWFGNNYRPTLDTGYSPGQPPTFSNGDKTVTIKLNAWKWSDGESVTSRDVVFWMNLIKVNPAVNWCGYAKGYFPDNVTSWSAPNPQTVVLNLDKAYDPEWVTYSLLSQITPMPLAWDRTSLAGCSKTCPVPSTLPDATKSGAAAVYKFLDAQSKQLASWGSSPLWSTVDGPFKVESVTSSGQVTFVPNPSYSGSPKPTISKFVELPFTSDAAIFNEERSGGPSSITIGNVPSAYAPQLSALAAAGYTVNKAGSYSFNYMPLNFNANSPIRYVFRQLYFRQALQHLVDQPGWIHAFFLNAASPTCGPIPITPPSPLVPTQAVSFTPCTYSPSAAKALLTANGWNVVPGGTTTCVKPGTATGDCGAGITKGQAISFTGDYESGAVAVQDSMNDLAANAKKLGINISLTAHPFNTVISTSIPCTTGSSTCKWEFSNWGGGWIYGPSYLPTGEPLYNPGSAANNGSYSDSKMTQLIANTITGPLSAENSAITAYSQYVGQQLPVIFQPTTVGSYGSGYAAQVIDSKLGGYAANSLGLMNPEDWYFTK
jgi:peptide/nickel transport system substrate-binding protein